MLFPGISQGAPPQYFGKIEVRSCKIQLNLAHFCTEKSSIPIQFMKRVTDTLHPEHLINRQTSNKP